MKVWSKGDRVQVRDRRDNAIVDLATVREQKDTTTPRLRDGKMIEEPSVTVYVDMDSMGSVGIPYICVEPVGQRERNP